MYYVNIYISSNKDYSGDIFVAAMTYVKYNVAAGRSPAQYCTVMMLMQCRKEQRTE